MASTKMNLTDFLEVERPIAELEAKISELRLAGADVDINIGDEIQRLQEKSEALTTSIFSSLTPHQVMQVARHPQRPHFCDYVEHLFEEFDELHGDRHMSDGPALMGGLARFNGEPVMVIGQEKGRNIKEKVRRNFGMPRPEEYQKALRLMKLAERFGIPVLTFIDTPGAYPGIVAEEHNQSEAIARNLFEMAQLRVPVICTVMGEGGSGGALAIGVGNRMLMLQYSIYSVISPEGCASILWKSNEKAPEAAEAMGITAERLLELELVDEVIPEPLGGAHRDFEAVMATVKAALTRHMEALKALSPDECVARRQEKFLRYGVLG